MRTHQLFRLCTVILTTLTLAALCLHLSDTGASVDNLTQETLARMFYHGLGYTHGMRTIPMGDWSLRDERDELYRNHILEAIS